MKGCKGRKCISWMRSTLCGSVWLRSGLFRPEGFHARKLLRVACALGGMEGMSARAEINEHCCRATRVDLSSSHQFEEGINASSSEDRLFITQDGIFVTDRLDPQIQKPRRTTCPGAALLLQCGASELRGVFVPCLPARGLVFPFVFELLRWVLSALIRRCEKRSFFILLTMRPATLL